MLLLSFVKTEAFIFRESIRFLTIALHLTSLDMGMIDIISVCHDNDIITSPPEGVARYCFHPVCLSVCVCVCLSVYLCVRPIFWYFISRLLEEISI